MNAVFLNGFFGLSGMGKKPNIYYENEYFLSYYTGKTYIYDLALFLKREGKKREIVN